MRACVMSEGLVAGLFSLSHLVTLLFDSEDLELGIELSQMGSLVALLVCECGC